MIIHCRYLRMRSMPTAQSLYLKAKHLLSDKITSECETRLQAFSVQSKFADTAKSCRTWHRLMSGFHPGQLSFLLWAASGTLPTEVNLRRWCVQTDAKCLVCESPHPTIAHIRCPVALTQQRYTFCHDQVLHLLTTKLKGLFNDYPSICVYADLQGYQSCETPQATIPTAQLLGQILLCITHLHLQLLSLN